MEETRVVCEGSGSSRKCKIQVYRHKVINRKRSCKEKNVVNICTTINCNFQFLNKTCEETTNIKKVSYYTRASGGGGLRGFIPPPNENLDST